jgi:hypothetical protein
MTKLIRAYQRSQILSLYELSQDQQKQAIDQLQDNADNDSFVIWSAPGGSEVLPLSMFVRIDNSIFQGVYGQTAFSAYFIRINRTNECATVVYTYQS